MGLRPSKCYKWDSPAYTRVNNNPTDSFITGIPANKINLYDMGNLTGDFDYELSIVAKSDIQVRHNSLEAARIVVQKYLEKDLGVVNFHFKVRVYPHHVIRENVMATGAGADRVQQGMRKSFGKPIGRAARVHAGQAIFSVYFVENPVNFKLIKGVLKKVIKKIPGDLKVTGKKWETKKKK